MTILRFPPRLADELRLAIRAARDEGDLSMAGRLQRVLRKYAACASHRPAGTDRRGLQPTAADFTVADPPAGRIRHRNDATQAV